MLLQSFLLAVLFVCGSVHAQLNSVAAPSIRVANVRAFCVNRTIPYIQADIIINDGDKGLPGILYVAMLDDDKQHPYFLGPGGWTAWVSGTIPIYSVMRQGLSNTTITLDLTSLPSIFGQNIYMGYGALTQIAERSVQGAIDAVAMMRQKMPGRKLPPTVDPDLHRLALAQDDMTRNAKYNFVLSSANFPICETN